MSLIHPTAVIDPRAELDSSVEVGPFAIIEGEVRVGAGTRILARAHLCGNLEIGRDNVVHMGAVIGHIPQISNYDGKPRRTCIGDGNVFREGVTVHSASGDDGVTSIGNGCFLMANSHVAHDCHLANGVILANGALLAGHVEVGDRAFISGNCTIHQFVRIGRLAMFQGLGGASKDVPPFAMMASGPNRLVSLNTVGMARAGLTPPERREIKQVFKALFFSGRSLPRAIAELRQGGECGALTEEILAFCEAPSRKGVCTGSSLEDRD